MTTHPGGNALRNHEHELTTEDGIHVWLKHWASESRPQKPVPVLLLHGASASSETFEVPIWNGGSRGIVDYLITKGFDVWALDWRGGMKVAGDPNHTRLAQKLTLDSAAQYDLPAGISFIRENTGDALVAIVGHCMGGAALAMAIGGGYITRSEVHKIVLTSMGLFYDVPWDGWVKGDDQALERSLIDAPLTTFIDSNVGSHSWPDSIESAYKVWPEQLLPSLPPQHPFRRLTFMFGRPFLEGLVEEKDQTTEALHRHFGAIPMALYIQTGQNVRRGFAAPYNDVTWSMATGRPKGVSGRLADDEKGAGKYLHAERFRGMRVTLITGALNMLWHPDSIRRMYDWLKRDNKDVSKAILPGYGHQDLYWARNAPTDVYPRILGGII
jgi:cholesterol oxidase